VVGAGDKLIAIIESPVGALRCQVDAQTKVGDGLTVAIRPENVALMPGTAAASEPNSFLGRVESLVYIGNMVECTVLVGPARLRVQLHPSVSLTRGASVEIRLPSEHCLAMRT
jgi:ABC-type Fe3+/spermidine/putrescine transport system ATPase subunit